jgi:putative colanic acid biosynthesis acetyltransferase WcaF
MVSSKGGREVGARYPLSHKLYRLGWVLSWFLFARWTPRSWSRWRASLLRVFGADVDPSATVYGSCRIWDPRNLSMGPHSTLGPRVDCYSMDRVSIGAHAIVSQSATLCAGSHDIRSTALPLVTRPIVIGAQAWICAEAFLGPGVKVGDGAVLGARGVAFHDLESWTVYRGNPACRIKRRVLAEE